MNPKKTVVLGASDHPQRYSYLAVDRLHTHQHPVVAIGNREGKIGEIPIITEHPKETGVDTVTVYLNPERQKAYYDYILQLHPRRVIFNPGTENEELEKLVQANGIKAVKACTLVLLSTGQY